MCAIAWGGDAPEVRLLSRGAHEGTPLHDKYLVTTIRNLRLDLGAPIVKTAIDAPFGWPEPFVDAVLAHHRGDGWPSEIDNSRAPYERRATDRFVYRKAAKTPLSVSADKIASPAMRCAVLLSDIRRHDGAGAVDGRGTGLVCEAYPDPALRRWTTAADCALGKRDSY